MFYKMKNSLDINPLLEYREREITNYKPNCEVNHEKK